MPQIFNDAVMTTGGAALLNKAIAGNCKLQFTRMAAGNGTYTDAQKTIIELQKLTALKSQKQSFALSSIAVETTTSVKATAVFTNTNLTTAYNINEMGLFAQEEGVSGTEVLYSVAVVSESSGEIMPIGNGKNPVRIIQSWAVTVSNSATVTLDLLSDDAFALASEVGQLKDLNNTDKSTIVAAINDVRNAAYEVNTDVSMTNSLAYPFNNSLKTIQITPQKVSTDYMVIPEVLSATGGPVGFINITDKLLNGFKIAYTGSASSATIRCHITGGNS